MERLFSPCNRMREIIDNRGLRRLMKFVSGYSEPTLQELSLDVSTDEFLSTESGFTYADLYAMLESTATVLWLTPHAAVARADKKVVHSWRQVYKSGHLRFNVHVDGKDIVALARSLEHLVEIYDVVIRLLAASVVHSITLHNWYHSRDVLINAASLAYLMERCQSLKELTLQHLALDENQIRVLGACSRPDLEICLEQCRITGAAAKALVEVLGRNQGPTKLDSCYLENFVLADGLRGNNRMKILRPQFIYTSIKKIIPQVLAIAGALRENKGLVDLNLSSCWVIDETWNAICDSLKTHPTLEVLDLRVFFTNTRPAPAVITSRMQALANMMKVNTSIHTIRLEPQYYEHELYRGSIFPYLATNQFPLRVRAIQKTLPSAYRAKVLSRALLATRTDANSFWMLLSGNAEVVAFASTATAKNLCTHATVGTAANASAVAVTAAATDTATRDASTTRAGYLRSWRKARP
jgi:hypothetical protein